MSSRSLAPRRAIAAGLLVVLPLLILLAATGCGGDTAEEAATSETVPVTVEPARRGPVQTWVRANAVISPAPGGEQIVAAPGPARIAEIPPGVGDRVHRGDLLVRFEIPSMQADVGAREADLKRGHARLENASAAIARAQALFERGVAARKEVEDAKREMADAEAALAEAKSGASAAGLLAQRLTVRALFDGVVAARAHNAGDLVDAGNETIRVLDPNRLEVSASVPARDLARMHEGGRATVAMSDSDPPQPARVQGIPLSVDPQTAIATVRLTFEKDPHLPAGAPVQVSILAEEKEDALIVPADALVREGEDTFVFTVDAQGMAHRKQVEVGLTSDTVVEIVSGVDVGESVVVKGANGLPDGAAVTSGP